MSLQQITQLLSAVRGGRREALDALLPLVYDQLQVMAHHRLGRAGGGGTLDTTALVHEAYLKLADAAAFEPKDRQHFFAVAATAMRQIIVDRARSRSSLKRGGGLRRVQLDSTSIAIDDQVEELVALDEALQRLATLDERLVKVVELRFFAGFTMAEIAELLGVHERTVERDWRTARAVLYRALVEAHPDR